MTTSTNALAQRYRIVRYTKINLLVTRGPDTGAALEIAASGVRVGTSPESDLVLTDGTVSRDHCEIIPTERGFRLRDCGSTNGVLVGSVWVSEAVFTGPTKIELGGTEITITPLAEIVQREQLEDDGFCDLIGSSPNMRELFAELERIAGSEISLLIHGETGTGKELVAESVHRYSVRRDKPLVVFDCSAVAPTLAE